MAENKLQKPQHSSDEEDDDRKPDIISRYRPGHIIDHERKGQKFTFHTENRVKLQIQIHTPDIIQLRYFLEGDVQSDFSYAIDPDFQSEEVDISFIEEDRLFEISTPTLSCIITKKNMLVHFFDAEGNMICEDEHGFYRRESLMKGISEIKVTKKAPKEDRYYGLGDKAYAQNLRGRAFENWNTDAYAYERGEDPLYRSIPFYAGLHQDRAYGIFLDNTYRTRFSFDRKENSISSFSAAGGVMNYYFINGPTLTEVSERFTRLTGKPEMPPMWALGYHQCRWSYYPESRVRHLASTFRKKQIPCDALYLDIDYMDEYRVFTWNNELFPNPAEMIRDLKEQGFKTIVMIDPGVKVDDDYPVYTEGRDNRYFCTRPDGEMIIAPVWPSKCAFPDFTHPDVRDWWGDLYEDLMQEKLVSGIWNDMNEPAVFEIEAKTFPEHVRHHFDGHPCSHKKAHNIYGMQMARASLEGIKKHNPDKRPFLLTRANFAGGQRYAALWTGDNIATWDHLKLANEQSQRLSISGYSFVGSDVGGFVENPSPELFSRWLQLAIFHPLFRNHTMGYNVDGAAAVKKEEVELRKAQSDLDQEPWVFGERFTDINRSIIELRYRLLHYLYTAFFNYVQHGTPIIRPLGFYDQTDEKALEENDAFMFGDHILVSPVLEKGAEEVETYLPKGIWYDFRSGECLKGKQTHKIDAPPSEIPFFVRAGTVLPLREVMQYTQERDPKLLELNVYAGTSSNEAGQLYEDAEEGYNYKKGDYRLTSYNIENSENNLTITASREGKFKPKYDTVLLNIIGLSFEPDSLTIDGKTQPLKKHNSRYTVQATPDFNEVILSG